MTVRPVRSETGLVSMSVMGIPLCVVGGRVRDGGDDVARLSWSGVDVVVVIVDVDDDEDDEGDDEGEDSSRTHGSQPSGLRLRPVALRAPVVDGDMR